MNTAKLILVLLVGSSFGLVHARVNDLGAYQPDFFAEKVAPIFAARCVMCHGSTVQRSGLDLRSENTALKGGSRGPSVVPGDPQKSLLYKLITHAEEPAMPMGFSKLSGSEVETIATWITGVTRTSTDSAAMEAAPVRAPGLPVTDKDRQFWSFQKLARPQVPAVKQKAWIRNEIDAFILKKLEEKGERPAPAADPRVLLRRVYFDLIGLPPTPEEMTEFLKDPSDAAYAKVIDRLLASSHYGERWGRHWLDLARYADSGGYEFDIDRPHAWRYRDWVIKALNDDLPYDQFIRLQLAADQISPQDAAASIPTGFSRNGPTVDNASNEETRTDELDDMVTTTSSVFLGLTVGCARCHDHKYDPIPQRDYYRMQAVFFPFKKNDRLLVGPAEAESFKARNKEIDALVKPYKNKVGAIEKPVRDELLREKVEFHVRLAESSNALEGKSREQFRLDTAKRFQKDVNLQPEEIEERLSPEAVKERKSLLAEIERINKTRPKPLPAAMGIADKPDPGKAYLLKRGDWRSKGEEVGPGLPIVIAPEKDLLPGNRRLQLADWIARAENPLTARVAVNRIWQYHFGKGIVRTSSDFGSTGDRPTHPQLLDWLATELVARGWSWKAMHRLILTSSTYRQRRAPQRIEAEIVRDSILAVSGKLNPQMGGPGIYPRIDPAVVNTGSRPRWPLDAKEGPDVWRRSVYIFVKRSVLLPLIEVFDCPATTVSSPVRSVSTVSPQALALLNNEMVLEQAGYFAERVSQDKDPVGRAFELALARQPTDQERAWSKSLSLKELCHALFNVNEFVYVD